MNINTYEHILIKYYNLNKKTVYVNPSENLICGKKPEFGNRDQSEAIRIIGEKNLKGRVVPNWVKIFSPFVGEVFGGKGCRKRKLISVSNAEFVYQEHNKHFTTIPRKFYNWAKQDNISILKK